MIGPKALLRLDPQNLVARSRRFPFCGGSDGSDAFPGSGGKSTREEGTKRKSSDLPVVVRRSGSKHSSLTPSISGSGLVMPIWKKVRVILWGCKG